MAVEPSHKRTIAFIDGQNLYHSAKKAFGYDYPNYDPVLLVPNICTANGWDCTDIYFYTGIPSSRDQAFWHHFWVAKLAVMGTRGIKTYSRELRYRPQEVTLPGGFIATIRVAQEKGIDIRLALDVVRLALENAFDVALVFSQDQDLSEMVDEVKRIAKQQNRWIKIACAFPANAAYHNRKGINKTDWIRIDKSVYDACLDPNDYRLKRVP